MQAEQALATTTPLPDEDARLHSWLQVPWRTTACPVTSTTPFPPQVLPDTYGMKHTTPHCTRFDSGGEKQVRVSLLTWLQEKRPRNWTHWSQRTSKPLLLQRSWPLITSWPS